MCQYKQTSDDRSVQAAWSMIELCVKSELRNARRLRTNDETREAHTPAPKSASKGCAQDLLTSFKGGGGTENGRLRQDILGAKRLSPKVFFKNALWWTNDAPAPAPRGLPVLKLALSLLYL